MKIVEASMPTVFLEFATHLQVIKNRSENTVNMYLTDLTLLFQYLACVERGADPAAEGEMDKSDLSALDIAAIGRVTTLQIYQFLNYCSKERHNAPRALARKLSALRTFFRFWAGNRRAISEDPTHNIDTPAVQKTLPKYLTLEESMHLLEVVLEDGESSTRERDFAILTLFLNCGLRLSELCDINCADMDPELRSLRVLGKGRKERIVYLNQACQHALKTYLSLRGLDEAAQKETALFLSSRHQRISNKTVQWMVYKYLNAAGLGNRHLSTHKLRHTAATLMYQTGEVDVLMLKEILGHESIGTTQIYTHVSNEGMAQAMTKNPLAGLTDRKISRRARELARVQEGWQGEEAIIEPVPVIEPAPAVEPVLAEAPAPAVEPVLVEAPAPAVEPVPVEAPAPAVEPAPVVEVALIAEPVPVEKSPIVDEIDPADDWDPADDFDDGWGDEIVAPPPVESRIDMTDIQDMLASLQKKYGTPPQG